MDGGTTPATVARPHGVTGLDVELALAEHLPIDVVPATLAWARAHAIDRRTLWTWLGLLEADDAS
jgi:hypothetical protein